MKLKIKCLNQHVVKHPKGWAVKSAEFAKPARLIRVVRTQQEAFRIARALAKIQRSELFVHGRDGRIRMKNSYGGDQHPPKG
jgi:hypothetical protein